MSDTITGRLVIDGRTYIITGRLESSGPGQSRTTPDTGELPDLPKEYRVQEVRFAKVGSKGGENAKGSWTRFYAMDIDSREYFSTFDTKLGAELKRLADSGEKTRIAFTENERGKTFVGYPQSDSEPETPPARQAPPPRQAARPAPAAPAPNPDDENLPF